MPWRKQQLALTKTNLLYNLRILLTITLAQQDRASCMHLLPTHRTTPAPHPDCATPQRTLPHRTRPAPALHPPCTTPLVASDEGETRNLNPECSLLKRSARADTVPSADERQGGRTHSTPRTPSTPHLHTLRLTRTTPRTNRTRMGVEAWGGGWAGAR
eukprot:scaffold71167_cov58-Phaeocystis_antarctica.AAC.5